MKISVKMSLSEAGKEDPLKKLPGAKTEVLEGKRETSFIIPMRLSSEEIKTIQKQEADVALLHKYDLIVDSALDVLEDLGMGVKVTNYGCWAKTDTRYFKVRVGHSGRAYLAEVDKKSWTSNGRYTKYISGI